MSAHTPGPWDYSDPDGKVRSPSGVIATVWDWMGDGGAGARDANARLIAAAPDMLIALRRSLNGCDGDLCMHSWHDVVRAAIALAEDGA